jgi:RNA polymerase sigma factor (sigma-70 family)
MNDLELTIKAKSEAEVGNMQEAVATLYTRYIPQISKYAHSVNRRYGYSVEDFQQDGFPIMLHALKNFNPDAITYKKDWKFAFYFAFYLRKYVNTNFRYAKKVQEVEMEPVIYIMESRARPLQEVEEKIQREQFIDRIKNPTQREVAKLLLNHYGYKEIIEKIGISHEWFYVTKRKLQKEYQEFSMA